MLTEAIPTTMAGIEIKIMSNAWNSKVFLVFLNFSKIVKSIETIKKVRKIELNELIGLLVNNKNQSANVCNKPIAKIIDNPRMNTYSSVLKMCLIKRKLKLNKRIIRKVKLTITAINIFNHPPEKFNFISYVKLMGLLI